MFDGTRGDAQPYLIASCALIKSGFEVMVRGPQDASVMASEFEVPFTPSTMSANQIFADPQMTEAFAKNDTAALLAANEKVKAKYQDKDSLDAEITAMYRLIETWKPDLITAGPVNLVQALMMAKIFQIPVISFSFQVQRPSSCVLPVGLPGADRIPKFAYRMIWRIIMRMMSNMIFRENAPVLSRLSGIPESKLYITVAEIDRYFSAKPKFLSIISASAIHGECPADFNGNNVMTGALRPTEKQENSGSFGSEEMAQMEIFLAAGDAPVYMGFGSMICGTSKFMTLLALRALKMTGERGIILKGWSSMSSEDLEGEIDEQELRAYCAKNVLFINKAPHGWLFPRCKVIVHHGGAGTLSASAKSGRPTVITPVCMDQPYHADLLNRMGYGVGTSQMAKLKVEELAEAVKKCINTPAIQEKAKQVAEQMAEEDASVRLVETVKDYMENHIKTGKHKELNQALDTRNSSFRARCLGLFCGGL